MEPLQSQTWVICPAANCEDLWGGAHLDHKYSLSSHTACFPHLDIPTPKYLINFYNNVQKYRKGLAKGNLIGD